MDLSNKTDILTLLQKYDLWAKKRFGQNFLIDKSALKKIVDTAEISPEDDVIEVGPGLGVLTQELAKQAKKVTTIELDRTLFPLLNDTFKDLTNIEIVNQDALKYEPPKTPYKIVANIPYNITSHLINHFLQSANPPNSMTLLVQKEVAEKLCTLEPRMTILSLQVALFGEAKKIKNISPGSFFPPPKVHSAIIHIKIREKNNPNFIKTTEALNILKIAKLAFSQKRKKISNPLSKNLQIDHDLLRSLMENIKISPDRRPETLSIQEWETLTKQIMPLLLIK